MEPIKILHLFQSFEVTDLRDHIYTALPLAVDYQSGNMPIDYGLPGPEVYINVVRYFINKKSTLDWFGYVGWLNLPTPGLLSWVPDLYCGFSCIPIWAAAVFTANQDSMKRLSCILEFKVRYPGWQVWRLIEGAVPPAA
jgi:hypothetical protein